MKSRTSRSRLFVGMFATVLAVLLVVTLPASNATYSPPPDGISFLISYHPTACTNAVDQTAYIEIGGCEYGVTANRGYCKNNVSSDNGVVYLHQCLSHHFTGPTIINKYRHDLVCLPAETNVVTVTGATGSLKNNQPWGCAASKTVDYTFLNITKCKCDYLQYVPDN